MPWANIFFCVSISIGSATISILIFSMVIWDKNIFKYYTEPTLDFLSFFSLILLIIQLYYHVKKASKYLELLKDAMKALSQKEEEGYRLCERISDLEAKNQCLKTQLEEASRRTDEAKERAASCCEIEDHGLCSVVIRMRGDGKTDEEVAVALQGFGCSNAQIGALLHLDPAVSEGARTKLAQRLLGKA